MKILLAGGGSGGSVAPLLAVAAEIKKIYPRAKFLLVGAKKGPEKQMAENAGLAFTHLPSGKWRRYFSLKNLVAPFLTLAGCFYALKLLREFKPDGVFAAGSFVQVPVIWMAWLLKIPAVIHQQDIEPSLANRLCEFCAEKITVCFEKSLTDFSSGLGLFYKKRVKEKVMLTGNPFRESLRAVAKEKAVKVFNLRRDLPSLLVLGGGTGSDFINQLVLAALPRLTPIVQVMHALGARHLKLPISQNYHPWVFISDMASAYAAADIVLSRAGLSTLTELSNLGKVSIIIPMPQTHQEHNAFLLRELGAAVVIGQPEITPEILTQIIRKLLFDLAWQKRLAQNISKIMPKNSAEKIAKVIIELIDRHGRK